MSLTVLTNSVRYLTLKLCCLQRRQYRRHEKCPRGIAQSSSMHNGDMYPYIKSKLGITVPYNRGQHTLTDFSAMCTSRPDDVALIAAKYRLSSKQALDIFLCKNHTLFDDVVTPHMVGLNTGPR